MTCEPLPRGAVPVPRKWNTPADVLWLASLVEKPLGKKRRRVGFWVLIVALAGAVMASAFIWPGLTLAPVLSAAAAVVSAFVAIRKADVSAEDAARAEAAQKTAERAARLAHLGLAIQSRPELGVWWYRLSQDFTHWDLLLTSDRPAKNIRAEWHFVDGREPVTGSWPEIAPHPDVLLQSEPRLVVPLRIPASVRPSDMHQYVAQGSLEYTDADGLARWRRTWRYIPPGPRDDPQMYLNAPKSRDDWELVELLELPDLE
jgi:hypothetical protein